MLTLLLARRRKRLVNQEGVSSLFHQASTLFARGASCDEMKATDYGLRITDYGLAKENNRSHLEMLCKLVNLNLT